MSRALRNPSSIYPEHFGLIEGSRSPRRARFSRGTAYVGRTSAMKVMGDRHINSLLERDLGTLLEADAKIKRFAIEPHTLTYFLPTAGGGYEKRTYTPDVVVGRADGKIVVMDAKAEFFRSRQDWQVKEPVIKEAYSRDHGVAFLVLTEAEIRAQPRLANCQMIVTRARASNDPQIELAVLDELSRGPGRIGSLYRRLPVPQRPIFAAVMALVQRGKLKFDLSRPLSADTVVARESRP
jgi:hypothetical protein